MINEMIGFRCGYIEIEKSKAEKQDMFIDSDFNVHGGVIYFEDHFPNEEPLTDKYVIGWDYGHWNDGMDINLIDREKNRMPSFPFGLGHVYTANEVESECIKAIDQAIELGY